MPLGCPGARGSSRRGWRELRRLGSGRRGRPCRKVMWRCSSGRGRIAWWGLARGGCRTRWRRRRGAGGRGVGRGRAVRMRVSRFAVWSPWPSARCSSQDSIDSPGRGATVTGRAEVVLTRSSGDGGGVVALSVGVRGVRSGSRGPRRCRVPGELGQVGAFGGDGAGGADGDGVDERDGAAGDGVGGEVGGLPGGPATGHLFAVAVGESPGGVAGEDFAAGPPHVRSPRFPGSSASGRARNSWTSIRSSHA